MNIDFLHSGAAQECKVTINVPYCGDVTWTFNHQNADQFYSGFACYAMRKQMGDALEKIRREAYESGWKDAKARKGAKETYFSQNW